MRVAFRADASVVIGSGHVMRCMTLAHALRERGAQILFVCREHAGNLCDYIAAKGFAVARIPINPDAFEAGLQRVSLPVHADWLGASWEADASLTAQAIGSFGGADWLVVDHYALDARWENALRRASRRIMVIDDLADRQHDCDLLLDQNCGDDPETRYDAFISEPCRKLLGPEYALLRPEFAVARGSLLERTGAVRRILIFFGGSDPVNATRKAIDGLVSLTRTDIDVDVVVGAVNPHRNEIERLCSSQSNFHFHCQISNMAELMAAADLAIGGGGVALLERCALALPAIIVAIAENQLPASRALASRGGAILFGNASNVSAERLARTVELLLLAPELVRHLAQVAGQITDGRGCGRVVANMLESMVLLRHAMPDDCEVVWRWRNDAAVRQFSACTSVIELQEHRQWYAAVLNDPSRDLLIGEDDDGPVGVLRYDVVGHSATISVYVVPERQGTGLGPRLIREGEAWLRERRPEVTRIRAEIGARNEASVRAFTSAGFVPDRLEYVRDLRGA